MSTSPWTDQPDRQGEDLMAEAVRVLTAAGRLTRPPFPRGVNAEQSADPVRTLDSGPERLDWAEFVSLALAGAAANLGGIEAVLASRLGSWEAEHVRTLLRSTVGDDETQLLRHRTEPVTVIVHVDELLVALGVWTAFEDAQAELSHRALILAHSTPPDEANAGPGSNGRQRERQADELDALQDRLWALYEHDTAVYGAALKANIEATAAALPDLHAPVVVTVDLDTVRPDPGPHRPDPVAKRLLQAGLRMTPLPGAGQHPLQRLHSHGTPSRT